MLVRQDLSCRVARLVQDNINDVSFRQCNTQCMTHVIIVMPSSDYTSAGGGLKLKGAKNAGVDKKRKKKKEHSSTATTEQSLARVKEETAKSTNDEVQNSESREQSATQKLDPRELRDSGKTDAERRHEELKRKRLDERLKREGIKTHKERVEELNKYLSTLSEHHDMPRIGPG
ncbi:hypothetical protein BT93_L4272 [Corymbia citriodora subsp. variegata]|uniref:DUF1754-domain-containing protein n=1 Tax=Corymbia citriodora subsp. variegata TaxID=360336 RepID=A0A8T0CG10_CORYI|nr:hypothetical protein BT93_L4272 [Corymbia citriodora subsp. variegata]